MSLSNTVALPALLFCQLQSINCLTTPPSASSLDPRGKRSASTAHGHSLSAHEGYWFSSKAASSTPPFLLERIRSSPPHSLIAGGFEPLEDHDLYEVPPESITGELPSGLRGTHFVNGAGRIRVGNTFYGHWFDGDGFIAALSLTGDGRAFFQSKYIRTKRYLAQEKIGASKLAMRGAWTNKPGGVFGNMFRIPTNPSNTAVLYYDNKLLALCEGGVPYQVDPYTLRSSGKGTGDYTFGGAVTQTFGAHLKRDPTTDVIYNFGVELSGSKLIIFKIFPPLTPGTPGHTDTASIGLRGFVPFTHDFAITENYIVVVFSAYVLEQTRSLGVLLGRGTIGGGYEWREDKGSRVVVLKKSDLSCVADFKTPAISFYHVANAFEDPKDNSTIRLHIARHARANREEVEKFLSSPQLVPNTLDRMPDLHELEISLKDKRIVRNVPLATPSGAVKGCAGEFPIINPKMTGKQNRYIYQTCLDTTSAPDNQDSQYFNAIQKVDLRGESWPIYSFSPYRAPNEAYFIAREGSKAEDDGWLLVPVYNAYQHISEYWIFEAADIAKGPISVISLPHHFPFTFHGTFVRGPKVPDGMLKNRGRAAAAPVAR
ncbi:unnamed protein product [Vitrella brassicaformis CCMP3155]|uniref:Carotenoid oxygenase n=1 Tax=Vitrella brassicaformis (strain CCMP3155) TaxID=1169540 RepID=A0A0G4EEU3_VITBC|nr:unnamed protein product [Vitrella brassicaformis CCMP3155]|eukprot:CEL93893.1 unnamed protein product [Vitrella brassicaformis CCMP3155]